jgi:nicotinate-nucleotide adenylyltransferase
VNTLERERARAVGAPLVFLIGADQLMALDSWRDWRRLLDLAHFGVAARPGHPIDPAAMSPALRDEYRARQTGADELASRPGGHICVYPVKPLDISSSDVREAIAAGRAPRDLVPPKVLDYIESRGLYERKATR